MVSLKLHQGKQKCLQLQVEEEDNEMLESNPELELFPLFLPSESSNWALGLIFSDG